MKFDLIDPVVSEKKMFRYVEGSQKWETFGTCNIYDQCLIRWTYQAIIIILASTVMEMWTFQDFSHMNALGTKFDLAIK